MPKSIAVLDLEWTTWEGAMQRRWRGPGEKLEIVQVGMVKLSDTAALEEVDHLEFFVRPTHNPKLSDYFIELTGIEQATVDQHGVAFPTALVRIQQFLDSTIDAAYCFGDDGFVIRRNCEYNDLDFPFGPDFFNSVIPSICVFLDRPQGDIMSSLLPEIMGFESPGNAHTALADARCIAEALRIMRRAGAF